MQGNIDSRVLEMSWTKPLVLEDGVKTVQKLRVAMPCNVCKEAIK